MNRLVTIESFCHQAPQGMPDRQLIAFRDLVLDDGVDGRMQDYTLRVEALSPVIAGDHVDAPLLVGREPVVRRGLDERIVILNWPVDIDVDIDVVEFKQLVRIDVERIV